MAKQFFHFKAVRIVDQQNIQIVREFNFPIAKEGTCIIHISDDANLLLEELKYKRVFLYEFKESETGSHRGKF